VKLHIFALMFRASFIISLTLFVAQTIVRLIPFNQLEQETRQIAFWGMENHYRGRNLNITDVNRNISITLFNNLSPKCPSWSPNGQKIAFKADDGLYVIDLAQGTTRQITQLKAVYNSPLWVNDQHILFLGEGDDIYQRDLQVFMIDENGENLQLKSHQPNVFLNSSIINYSWSPQGNQIVVWAGSLINILDVETNELRRIDFPQAWYISQIDWSSDAQFFIVQASYRLEDITHLMIYQMNIDGTNIYPLYELQRDELSGSMIGDISVSPNNEYLAFVTAYDMSGSGGIVSESIALLNLIDGNVTYITNYNDLYAEVTWSQDSQWIAFKSAYEAEYDEPDDFTTHKLYVVRAEENGQLKRIPFEGMENFCPAWRP
jgi:Tol biopolymer transport system component